MRLKKAKQKSKPLAILSNPTLFIPIIPQIKPIYGESISSSLLTSLNNFEPWQGSTICNIISLPHLESFSVIFILIPSSLRTDLFFLGYQAQCLSKKFHLANLIKPGYLNGRLNLWEGWSMLIIPTPFLFKPSPKLPLILEDENRILGHENPLEFIFNLLMQAVSSS